jgi:hypothetical protein
MAVIASDVEKYVGLESDLIGVRRDLRDAGAPGSSHRRVGRYMDQNDGGNSEREEFEPATVGLRESQPA